MIPQNKVPLVEKALLTAFNTTSFEDIVPMTKGLSTALIYRIIVRGQPYLLRIVMRTDAIADPALYYASMETAAQAGVAPPIYYLSVEDRISITGFVAEQPFSEDLAKKLVPPLLRKLHATPKFAFRLQYFDSISKWLPRYKEKNVLSEKANDELMARYQRIIAIYPVHAVDGWVSCHNDTKAENIVFDGTRPWLVDWESAFLNDRYLDLAIIGNFLVSTREDEEAFLSAYFDRLPTEDETARFYVMRAILHFFYFTFLIALDNGENPIDVATLRRHDFNRFHKEMWGGGTELKDAQIKREYAMIHFERFMTVTDERRMQESLQLISAWGRANIVAE